MKKYQSYKSSEVQWIGEIPEHWNCIRLKYEYKIQKGKIPKSISENVQEGLIPYLSMDVLRGSEPSGFVDKEDGLFVVKDQILILWDGSNSGEIIKLSCEGILSSTMGVMNKIGNKLISDLSYYQLKSFEPEIRNNTNGMGIPHVDGSHLRDLSLFIPPIQEQQQIVQFLDEKTELIDKLISTKEKKIDLLKQKRTSLINEVITKGLDPNVKMKDSGVEWIGEIPDHWGVSKLGFYTKKIGSGSTPKGGSEIYPDDGIPFIRSQNVHFDGLRTNSISFIDQETHKSMKGSRVVKNDVLLNITGGSIGRCCVVDIKVEMNVNQHVSIIRTKSDLFNYFLNYILSSDIGQLQVLFNLTGGNREGLTIDGIKNFRIMVPPIQEQQQIVEYLDTHTKDIDDLVSMEKKKIDLLKEYRQSIISEVITGKIDVRTNLN